MKKRTKEYLTKEPRFTIGMAGTFFDMTPRALKWREKRDHFLYPDGSHIEPIREGDNRKYSLEEIRAMAHSLRRLNKITTAQFNNMICRIDAFSTPIKRSYWKGNR